MSLHAYVFCAGIAAVLLASSLVRAEPLEASAAQTLFDDARALMKRGDYPKACEMLADSQRLEPGAGTLLNLGLCREREGKWVTAWLVYADATVLAAKAQDDQRQQLARERMAALEPRLPRIVLKLPTPLPSGFWVEIDGVTLAAAAREARLPLDPGRHQLRYGARGYAAKELDATANEGETQMLALEPLRLATRQVRLASQPSNAPAREHQRAWTIAGSAGAGLAGLGIAAVTYFGLQASSAWERRQSLCQPRCTQAARDAGEHARRAAWGADVGAVVAAAGASVALYAFVLRPRPATRAAGGSVALNAALGPSRAALALEGSF